MTWRGVFAIMGLITELTGVVLFSWGLLTQPVGWFRLWNLPAGHKEFWHGLAYEPWFIRWPVKIALSMSPGPPPVSDQSPPTHYRGFAKSFWGLVLIGGGFILQALATLLIAFRHGNP